MPEEKNDKVTLDDKEVSSERGSQKVELDLDDAPFLMEKEEEEEKKEKKSEEKVVEKEEEQPLEEEKKKVPLWKKWWFLGLVVMVLAGVAVFFVIRPFKPKSKEIKKPQEKPKEIVKPETPPSLPEEKITLAPFWIEYFYKNQVRWLHVQFMLTLSGRFVLWEIDRKRPILRDSIYYYFKNKDLSFLTDKKNIKKIKKDLKTILNQYLDRGKIEKILIQKYVLE